MTDAPQFVPGPKGVPQTAPMPRDWRSPLSIGLAVGTAFAVSRGVQTNLEPMIGYWGAFAASIAAAGAVGALVAMAVLGVFWMMKRRETTAKTE
jgi:hypothetical protein